MDYKTLISWLLCYYCRNIQENSLPVDSLPFLSMVGSIKTPPTVITDILTHLPSIKETYLHYCGVQDTSDPSKQDSMIFPSLTEFITTFDWPYLPLIINYTAAIDGYVMNSGYI